MEKVNLVVWTGNTLIGGVDVWVKELRRQLDGSRYNLITISDGDTFAGDEKVDIYIHSWEKLRKVLTGLSPAVVMPNWRHKVFGACAGLNERGARLRCIGACHADSDAEYYKPLAWYEPAISRFMAVSEGCAETLAKHIPHRRPDIRLINYGITVPRAAAKSYSLKPLKIVYAGRITQEQKNVLDLVKIAAGLEKAGIPYSLDIIGSGPDKGLLASAMGRSRLRCNFTGQLAHSAFIGTLTRYDVFIQPSSYEGRSVGMLEAMAARVIPCVARSGGGGWRVIADNRNGFTFGIGDIGAAVAALKRVASMTPGEAEAAGEAAMRSVEDGFSIGRNIRAFTSLVDECMQDGPRKWPRAGIYDMPGGPGLNYLPESEGAGILMKTAFRVIPRVRLRHLVRNIGKGRSA